MKRGIIVLVCVCLLTAAFYVGISKWGIEHETLNMFDASRQRPIAVDLAVRRDYAIKADDGFWKLPVAVISNGNTVKNTEYSFLANALAAKGYMVASIQQDLPTDPPLMTVEGQPYVGRLGVYKKGEANILYVLGQLKTKEPNADYTHLTMVGHSNGGDTAMYFAKEHPDIVRKVITLDNLRVPFVTGDRMKILSFRSDDPNFKTDPGVLPSAAQALRNGIDIIKTPFQHTQMSDRGPSSVKDKIQEALDKFLNDTSDLSPNKTDNPEIGKPAAPAPAPDQAASQPAESKPAVPKPAVSTMPAPAMAPIVSNPPTPAPGATKSGS